MHTYVLAHCARDSNIAQRNLSITTPGKSTASFILDNPTDEPLAMALAMDCDEFPIHRQDARVELVVASFPGLTETWSGVPGTTVWEDAQANTHVQFHRCRVTLPLLSLAPDAITKAQFELDLPPELSGTRGVHLRATVDGQS